MWQKILDVYYAVTAPAVYLLARMGITPAGVTLAGLVLNIIAGAAFAWGRPGPALVLMIIAGICDTFDGQLARRTGRDAPWGAFLDSVADRVSETALHLGICWYFMHRHPVAALVTVGALGAAYMVSYTRARAEGLGIACKTGAMQRPHRFLALTFGSMAGYPGILAAMVLIAVLSAYTALQRTMTVYREALK